MSSPVKIAFSIENLDVSYRQGGGELCVVKDVSLQLRAGEILGVAGESGCGKSTAVLASTGFPIPGMTSRNGRALLGDTDLLQLNRKELREILGAANRIPAPGRLDIADADRQGEPTVRRDAARASGP